MVPSSERKQFSTFQLGNLMYSFPQEHCFVIRRPEAVTSRSVGFVGYEEARLEQYHWIDDFSNWEHASLGVVKSVPQRGSVWLVLTDSSVQSHTLPRCGTDALVIRDSNLPKKRLHIL